jgi:hypothetical protein
LPHLGAANPQGHAGGWVVAVDSDVAHKVSITGHDIETTLGVRGVYRGAALRARCDAAPDISEAWGGQLSHLAMRHDCCFCSRNAA